MQLTIDGKRGDVNDNGNLDFVSKSSNSKGKLDINSQPRDKTEKPMGIKREVITDERMAVHLDAITRGVRSCKIAGESPASDGLTAMLENLKLGETRAEKKSVEQKPQPKEVDEREDSGPRFCRERDLTNKKLSCDVAEISDNLVKLEAPSFGDLLENEAPFAQEEGETTLGERGPMLGVAANYKMEPGHNYIASKNFRPYQIQSDNIYPTMPQNFPDYSYQNSGLDQCKGSKRGMDVRESHLEPLKFVRPQNVGYMEINLSSPGGVPNNVAGTVNGKTISQVYQKQMSGGTVYTPEDMMFNNGQVGGDGSLEQQGSFDFQDLLDLGPFGPDDPKFNVPVNTEDFLPSSGPSSLQAFVAVDHEHLGMVNQAQNGMSSVGLGQLQQWHRQQGPLPPVSTLTSSFNHHPSQQQHLKSYNQQTLQQQQQQQHFQEHGQRKRGSFGNACDDGYTSDLSPSHEMQSSPMPSPQSVMHGSPSTFSGSPPRTNWSPPPSNMSHSSTDSGVCSPMSEDLSGYISQKSPRQGQVASPQSMVSVPRTPSRGRVSASPPHQQVLSSPPHQPMLTSPPHQSMLTSPPHQPMLTSPPHQSMRTSPPHQSMLTSPPHQMLSCPPHQQVLSSPPHQQVLSSPPHQSMLTSQHKMVPEVFDLPPVNDDYKSYYIDTHLPELDCALEVASEDLMDERNRRKGTGVAPPPLQNVSLTGGTTDRNCARFVGNNGSSIMVGANNKAGVQYQMPVAIVRGNRNLEGVINANVMANPAVIENMPNLPTTISSSDKKLGAQLPLNPGINQLVTAPAPVPCGSINNAPVQVPPPPTQGALIFKSASPPATHPQVNSNGKIAISPITPKYKPPPNQGQMVPLFVATNGVVTPLLLMPSTGPPVTTPNKPSLRPLAPKDPRPTEKSNETCAQPPPKGGNSQASIGSAGQEDKSPNSSPPTSGKKSAGPSVEKLLNLARRLVADMSTNDLKYQDDDLDTYLHVAVCKADRFMVQALLERLDREKLSKMIDVQNYQGQTPLYLAVSTNHAEMVRLLIEHNADVNSFAWSVTTAGIKEETAAIHCAATKGEAYLETLKTLLMASHINLNQINSEGHTALICAILAHGKVTPEMVTVNSIPIIQALIRAGADPNLQVQQSGKTALMFALESRDLDLIESTFDLVEPYKLPAFLKTQAFGTSSCLKIAESLKSTLDFAGQQRLTRCLRPGNNRGTFGTS